MSFREFVAYLMVGIGLLAVLALALLLDLRSTPIPECDCPCMTPGDELRIEGHEPRQKAPSPYTKSGGVR